MRTARSLSSVLLYWRRFGADHKTVLVLLLEGELPVAALKSRAGPVISPISERTWPRGALPFLS